MQQPLSVVLLLPDPESEGCQNAPVHVHGGRATTQCLVKRSSADGDAPCKERALLKQNLVQECASGRACFLIIQSQCAYVSGSALSCHLHRRHKALLENEVLPTCTEESHAPHC